MGPHGSAPPGLLRRAGAARLHSAPRLSAHPRHMCRSSTDEGCAEAPSRPALKPTRPYAHRVRCAPRLPVRPILSSHVPACGKSMLCAMHNQHSRPALQGGAANPASRAPCGRGEGGSPSFAGGGASWWMQCSRAVYLLLWCVCTRPRGPWCGVRVCGSRGGGLCEVCGCGVGV